MLLTETYTQGGARLANDLKAAFNEIQTQPDVQLGWKNANIVIEQGTQREVRALNSVTRLVGEDSKIKDQIKGFSEQLLSKEKLMRDEIASLYKSTHGVLASKLVLTAEEKEATKKVPVNNPNLDEYFGKRTGRVQGIKIHSTMRMEVFNYVNGKRNYYEIYKAVLAEILAAGNWYYGTLTLEDVTKLLDANVTSGALSLKK